MKKIKIIKARKEDLEGLGMKFHIAEKEIGDRFVFSDNKNNPEGEIYSMLRKIDNIKTAPEYFVEEHSHKRDSLFMFIGTEKDLTGFDAEVISGNEKYVIKSPMCVYIPAGISHSYRPLKGKGYFINIVISEGGDYNRSLKNERRKKTKDKGIL